MAAGFTCKQFFVAHGDCAMKVGTDSLVLGAWTQRPIQGDMLDIGCGSAILSLMLAQRSQDHQRIDAVELCPRAAAQAVDNVQNCPWAHRLRVIQGDILTYPDSADHLGQRRYALIIANPPYFQHSLKNDLPQKQQARHTDSLSFADLLKVSAQLATEDGYFSLILPMVEAQQLLALTSHFGWSVARTCPLVSQPDKAPIRLLLTLSRQPTEVVAEAGLLVRDASGQYSAEYRQLLREFYLNF